MDNSYVFPKEDNNGKVTQLVKAVLKFQMNDIFQLKNLTEKQRYIIEYLQTKFQSVEIQADVAS